MTDIDRRTFLAGLSAASALTIVPRRVLGGPGYIAPSDMMLLAQVGCGTQAQRQVNTGWSPRPDVQFVAVVDPNRDSAGLRRLERVRQPRSDPPVPRGPAVGRERHGHPRRARRRARRSWRPTTASRTARGGIRAYEDYREMLEKETDIQGVVNITPDHQHGSINIAALRKGKAAISHKPVASVLHEVRRTLQAARESTRRVAPARLQQQARPAHAGGVDQRRRRSAPCAKCTTGPNRPFWPQGMQAYHASGAARARRLQLGAVAGSRAGSPVPSELHVRRVPRLVCLRNRLPRRHGPLQPVAAVPHPRISACRSGSRRGRTTTRGSTTRTSATAATCRRSRLPQSEQRPLASSRDGRRAGRRHVLVRRRHEAADAGRALRGRRGPRRRGHADRRRQGQDPLRLPRQRAAADSEAAASRRSRDRSPCRTFDSHQARRRVDQRDQARQEVARQLRGRSRALAEAVTLANIALRVPYKRLLWDSARMEFTNSPEANRFVRREQYRPAGTRSSDSDRAALERAHL